MAEIKIPFDHVSVEDFSEEIKKITADSGYRFRMPNGDTLPVIYVEDFGTLDGITVEADTQEEQTATETEAEAGTVPYEVKVNDLIRQRYTLSEELALLRQQASKADEYKAYYDYCEECKATAKQILAEEATAYGGRDSSEQ